MAVSPDFPGIAVMINFTHAADIITSLLKELPHGDGIGSEFSDVVAITYETGSIGPQPGHNTGPAWPAQGKLTISPIKPNPHGSKPIKIRSLNLLIAITSDISIQIVGSDKQNINRFRCYRYTYTCASGKRYCCCRSANSFKKASSRTITVSFI